MAVICPMALTFLFVPFIGSVRPDGSDQAMPTQRPDIPKDLGSTQIAVTPGSALVGLRMTTRTAGKPSAGAPDVQDSDAQMLSDSNGGTPTVSDDLPPERNTGMGYDIKGMEEGTFSREGTIFINAFALEELFRLIRQHKTDSDAKVDTKAWTNSVRGQWADIMFPLLYDHTNHSTDEVSKDSFKSNWGAAVATAYKKMGGDDGPIMSEDVDKWKPCEEYEKTFAKRAFLTNNDGKMGPSHFEEFLYVVMYSHAWDVMLHPGTFGAQEGVIDEKAEKAKDEKKAKEALALRSKALYELLQFLSGLHRWEQEEQRRKEEAGAVRAASAPVVVAIVTAFARL